MPSSSLLEYPGDLTHYQQALVRSFGSSDVAAHWSAPSDTQEWSEMIQLRHNWVHNLICSSNNIPYGEKKFNLILKDLGFYIDTSDSCFQARPDLWNQTADIVIRKELPLNHYSIVIMDVSVTNDVVSVEISKENKYSWIRDKINKHFRDHVKDPRFAECYFLPLVFGTRCRHEDNLRVIQDAKLNSSSSMMITEVINVFTEFEDTLLQHASFKKMKRDFLRMSDIQLKFTSTEDDFLKELIECERKPISVKDAKDFIKGEGIFDDFFSEEISPKDDEALEILTLVTKEMNDITSQKDSRSTPLFIKAMDALKEVSAELQSKDPMPKMSAKKISPLPLVLESYAVRKGTTLDRLNGILSGFDEKTTAETELWMEVKSRLNSMTQEERSTFNQGIYIKKKNGRTKKLAKHCINVPIDSGLRDRIAVYGPGRKQLMKNQGYLSDLARLKAVENDNRQLDPFKSDDDINELDDLIMLMGCQTMSKAKPVRANINQLFVAGQAESDAILKLMAIESTVGYVALKRFQSIFREIALNSKRKRSVNEFVLTMTEGYSCAICIMPGAYASRKEAGFWVTTLNEEDLDDIRSPLIGSSASKSRVVSRFRYFTTPEIEHYLRCADMLMAGVASLSMNDPSVLQFRSGGDKTEKFGLTGEYLDNDTLGFTAFCITELSKGASQFHQDVRYIAMQNLSILCNSDSCAELFKAPIRSYIMLRSIWMVIHFCSNTKGRAEEFCQQGRVSLTTEDDLLDESSGSKVVIPRLLTKGPDYNMEGLINEFYYCNLYYKSLDNSAQAAMRIMTKMTTAQEKFEDNIKSGKLSGDGLDYERAASYEQKVEVVREAVKYKGQHRYQARFIKIGSVIQRKKFYPVDSEQYVEDAIRKCNFHESLNELASFKASISGIVKGLDASNLHFFGSLSKVNQRLKDAGMAKRQKCIQNALKIIINLKKFRLDEAADDLIKSLETVIQIFKKEQIGGAREILILLFASRICVNIVERFFRQMCSIDPSEKLTHAKDKIKRLGGIQTELSMHFGDAVFKVLHNNDDMTKWCEGFDPFCFIYMALPLKKVNSQLFWHIARVLVKHCNKSIEFPPEYVAQVILNSTREFGGEEPEVKNFKKKIVDEYLKSGSQYIRTHFKNTINMGQGILHYSSSYLHLAKNNVRSNIMGRIVESLGLPQNCYKVIEGCSSDDAHDAFAFDVKKVGRDRSILVALFHEATVCSGRVVGIQYSMKKSSKLNTIFGEFNSNFFSSNHIVTPEFKFAVAAIVMMNTMSPSQMVSAYWSASMQIISQGGSLGTAWLVLCINRDYFEDVYKTNPGGYNADDLGLHDFCPIDLGFFHIPPAHLIMAGPDLITYVQFKSNKMNENQITAMKNGFLLNLKNGDAQLGDYSGEPRSCRIQIHEVTSKLLLREREYFSREGYSKEWLDKVIDKDPLLLVRSPMSSEECIAKSLLKLYSLGAHESYKQVSVINYHLRAASTRDSSIFQTDSEKNMSFKMAQLDMRTKRPGVNYDAFSLENFPKKETYEEYARFSRVSIRIYKDRSAFQPRKVRKIYMRSAGEVLRTSLREVLMHRWLGEVQEEDMTRKLIKDAKNIERCLPWFKQSMQESLISLYGNVEHTVEMKRSMISKLQQWFGYQKSQHQKALLFGSENNSISESISSLIRQNSLRFQICELDEGTLMDSCSILTKLHEMSSAITMVYSGSFKLSDQVGTKSFELTKCLRTCNDLEIQHEGKYYRFKDFLERFQKEIQDLRLDTNLSNTLHSLYWVDGKSSETSDTIVLHKKIRDIKTEDYMIYFAQSSIFNMELKIQKNANIITEITCNKCIHNKTCYRMLVDVLKLVRNSHGFLLGDIHFGKSVKLSPKSPSDSYQFSFGISNNDHRLTSAKTYRYYLRKDLEARFDPRNFKMEEGTGENRGTIYYVSQQELKVPFSPNYFKWPENVRGTNIKHANYNFSKILTDNPKLGKVSNLQKELVKNQDHKMVCLLPAKKAMPVYNRYLGLLRAKHLGSHRGLAKEHYCTMSVKSPKYDWRVSVCTDEEEVMPVAEMNYSTIVQQLGISTLADLLICMPPNEPEISMYFSKLPNPDYIPWFRSMHDNREERSEKIIFLCNTPEGRQTVDSQITEYITQVKVELPEPSAHDDLIEDPSDFLSIIDKFLQESSLFSSNRVRGREQSSRLNARQTKQELYLIIGRDLFRRVEVESIAKNCLGTIISLIRRLTKICQPNQALNRGLVAAINLLSSIYVACDQRSGEEMLMDTRNIENMVVHASVYKKLGVIMPPNEDDLRDPFDYPDLPESAM